MKKRTKLVISIILVLILILSITLNIVLGIKYQKSDGTNTLSGFVNETWRMNEASILSREKTNKPILISELDQNHYYSNNGNDYIYHVLLEYYFDGKYEISYDTEFSNSNDLEAYFVLENLGEDGGYYTTDVERSYTHWGRDGTVPFEWEGPKAANVRICQVWVRTLDD